MIHELIVTGVIALCCADLVESNHYISSILLALFWAFYILIERDSARKTEDALEKAEKELEEAKKTKDEYMELYEAAKTFIPKETAGKFNEEVSKIMYKFR